MAELEQIGTKTILVPAERKWDDQFARARSVEHEYSRLRVLRQSSAAGLASLARAFLLEPLGEFRGLAPPEGAQKAAELLYAMLVRSE